MFVFEGIRREMLFQLSVFIPTLLILTHERTTATREATGFFLPGPLGKRVQTKQDALSAFMPYSKCGYSLNHIDENIRCSFWVMFGFSGQHLSCGWYGLL